MADTLVKIGILGESTAFSVEDETARENAGTALLRAQSALGMFPVSQVNGGTGGTSLLTARNALEITHDAQAVMGVYEGRSLAEVHADEISGYANEAEWFNARVMANNWVGIRIKDYFDITLADGKVFRYRLGAANPYLNTGHVETTDPHAIMVPDQAWPDSIPWNATATNQGTASEDHPYLASNLHKWETNTFFPLLPAKWRSVIATHSALLECRYDANAQLPDSNGYTWEDVGKVFSLSEQEVYGGRVWGTRGYSVGSDFRFPIFDSAGGLVKRTPSGERCHWWLRVVSGSSTNTACVVNSGGLVSFGLASDLNVRPLPCFRVGV